MALAGSVIKEPMQMATSKQAWRLNNLNYPSIRSTSLGRSFTLVACQTPGEGEGLNELVGNDVGVFFCGFGVLMGMTS